MVFQFHHRKLIETAINETLNRICKGSCQHPTEDSCFPLLCLPVCPTICLYPLPLPHDYSPPPKNSHNHPSTAVVVTLAVLASTFLLVCLSALYLFFYRRSRSRSLPAGSIPEELFLDQDRGPLVAVDHPIWYINTVGLQPSVISAIAVCKYKRGDGLVEGTDCSVCLSEFREGDTLRLLPKCSHAFHIPCIDTWLRSHTNCPMCRAGIVAHRPLSHSPALLGENSSGRRTDAHLGTSDDNGESAELRNHRTAEGRATLSIVQNGCCGSRNEAEAFDGVQPVRRSVSMDPAAAAAIGSALAKNDGPVESAGNSNALSANIDKLNLGTVSKGAGGGNRSLLKVMGTSSSSIGRYLQPGPMSLKRSLSCGGMAEAKNSETLFSNMIISLYGDSF